MTIVTGTPGYKKPIPLTCGKGLREDRYARKVDRLRKQAANGMLGRDDMAAFLSISADGFDDLVGGGYLPKPLENVAAGTVLWSTDATGRWFDMIPAERKAPYWTDPVVYFVGMGRGTATFIKIGIATNLPRRLSQIQTHHPQKIRLLGFEWGGKRRERALHARFAHLSKRGEWFAGGADLLAYIRGLPNGRAG